MRDEMPPASSTVTGASPWCTAVSVGLGRAGLHKHPADQMHRCIFISSEMIIDKRKEEGNYMVKAFLISTVCVLYGG